MTAQQATDRLKFHAKRLGFMDCRVAQAEFLEDEAPKLEAWLQHGYHASMRYMENHFDKRLDPRKLVPGAQSVVSLAYNYYPGAHGELPFDGAPKIASYAWGEDYHRVVKDKLFELLDAIREEVGNIQGRCFVDSAPVMERAWAERSGLGWIGKHGLALKKSEGSYFFLAELIVDAVFEPDQPDTDHCGDCTRCIEACPTDAILQPQLLDSERCISHMTIELHGAMPEAHRNQIGDWVFGCDICQQVCPWNRHATPHQEPRFAPGPWMSWSTSDWRELTEDVFGPAVKDSPLSRPGWEGLKRNLAFAGFLKTSD